MSADIRAELNRISRLVDEALQKAAEDTNRRGVLHSGSTVNLKCKYSAEILESELNKISKKHHHASDKAKIMSFLDLQKEKVSKSINKNGLGALGSVQFDKRIEEIKSVVNNRHYLYKKDKYHSWIKFWIPVTISTIALTVSIFALLTGANE